MDNRTIFTKTAKGVREALEKTRFLSRDVRRILVEIDGTTSIEDLLDKVGTISEAKLETVLLKLIADDYIREFATRDALSADTFFDFGSTIELENAHTQLTIGDFFREVSVTPINTGNPNFTPDAQADTTIAEPAQAGTSSGAPQAEAVRRTRIEAGIQAKRNVEEKARQSNATVKEESPARAKLDREATTRRESEAQAKLEANEAARAAAGALAQREQREQAEKAAEAQTKKEAETLAKKLTEESARQKAEEAAAREAIARKAAEQEAQARKDQDEQARREARAREQAWQKAEEAARVAAEALAQREKAAREQKETEERARLQAEETARVAAAKARLEEEAISRQQAARAAQEREEQARMKEAERVHKEQEERIQREAEAQARQEAEERAEERARLKNEEIARVAAAAKARLEAMEKAKQEAAARKREEQARLKEEERVRKEQERHAQREAETRRREEQQEQARLKTEEMARIAAAKAAQETAEKAEREAAAKATKEREEQERLQAREAAHRAAEERARRDEEQRIQREAEARARQEEKERAKEQARLKAEEAARQAAEERARRDDEKRAQKEAKAKAKELARQKAEEESRLAAEERARRKAEAKAEKEAALQARRREQERAGLGILRHPEPEATERALQDAKTVPPKIAQKAGIQSDSDTERAVKRWSFTRPRDDGRSTLSDAEAPEVAAQTSDILQNTVTLPAGKFYLSSASQGRRVGFALLLLVVAGLAWLHLAPFNGKRVVFEQAASAQFGQPVKIGQLNFSLMPQPHWHLEDVTIGNADQIRIPQVQAVVALDHLLDEQMTLKSAIFHSPMIDAEGLRWLLFSRSKAAVTSTAAAITSGQISARNVKFISHPLLFPSLNASVTLDRDGGWRKIAIDVVNSSSIKNMHVELARADEGVQLQASAEKFKPPFASSLALENFNAVGAIHRNELALAEFNATVFSGMIKGDASLKWGDKGGRGDSWSLDGKLDGKLIDATQFAPALLQRGVLEGAMQYAMQARDADKLFAAPLLNGRFTARNGVLTGVDLASVLRGANAEGKSSFNSLSADFSYDGARTQLSKVDLNAGLIAAGGNIDVNPDKTLRGNFVVRLASSSAQARAQLRLGGTLFTPKFER